MRTTTITHQTAKTLTAVVALSAALLVGSSAGPAAAKTIATGGGQQVSTTSVYPGFADKLNAMLDELPNAGVGRPGR
jgi:hypothetical protein